MSTDVLTGKPTFASMRPLDLSRCTKREIKDYFENSFGLNESLFTSLKDDSVFYKCPDRLRLPLVFYFAHTAAVYVNKLLLVGLMKERINPDFEELFETGVDEMSWDDTENYRMGGSFKWPSLKEIMIYRRQVKKVILQVIEETSLSLPINMDSPWWGLFMGMEHERIHLETSSVLIRQLPIHLVSRPDGWFYGPMKYGTPVKDNPMICVVESEVTVGKPQDFPSYGWDNEYGQMNIHVPQFRASKFLVTNRDFLSFVQSGGYTCKKHWSEEGWKWREFRQATHPVFWVCGRGCKGGCGGDMKSYSHCQLPAVPDKILKHEDSDTNSVNMEYRLRLMFDLVNLPLDWPVEVNYHEAKAYCRWKGVGYRLPTEAEHHAMRGVQRLVSEGTDSDVIFQNKIDANLNLQYGSSTPVNLYPSNELGFHDVFGNVWQWTEDHFNGLPCFNTHWLYDDFSSPCFDGKHNVMLGGSWISTGDEASRFARFAFRRHFFQHLGFRLAETIDNDNGKQVLPARIITSPVFVLGQGEIDNATNMNECDCIVSRVETTNLHYKSDAMDSLRGILELEFGFRDSGVAVTAGLCETLMQEFNTATDSAVHLGSGVGRGALELSRHFKHVLGIEPVGRFVDSSLHLQRHRHYDFTTLHSNTCQRITTQDYDCNPERIVFKQFTWVPNEVGSHDLVFITHMERVQNPKAWFMRVWEITRTDGIAVVASLSGQWNEEKLEPMLGQKMTCVLNQTAHYQSPKGEEIAVVTVWRRRL